MAARGRRAGFRWKMEMLNRLIRSGLERLFGKVAKRVVLAVDFSKIYFRAQFLGAQNVPK